MGTIPVPRMDGIVTFTIPPCPHSPPTCVVTESLPCPHYPTKIMSNSNTYSYFSEDLHIEKENHFGQSPPYQREEEFNNIYNERNFHNIMNTPEKINSTTIFILYSQLHLQPQTPSSALPPPVHQAQAQTQTQDQVQLNLKLKISSLQKSLQN